MADQFRQSFDEMARQSELDELRTELEALRHERPLADLDHALNAPVLPPPDPAPASAEASAEPAVPEAHEDVADAAERVAANGPRQ
jgi:sec-independent protein translocase protein TatB